MPLYRTGKAKWLWRRIWGPEPRKQQESSQRKPRSAQSTIWKTLIRDDALIVDKEWGPGAKHLMACNLISLSYLAGAPYWPTDSEGLLAKMQWLLEQRAIRFTLSPEFSHTYRMGSPLRGYNIQIIQHSPQSPSERHLNLTTCSDFQLQATRSAHTQPRLWILWLIYKQVPPSQGKRIVEAGIWTRSIRTDHL